jgi:Zn-dependent protease with chaperone function
VSWSGGYGVPPNVVDVFDELTTKKLIVKARKCVSHRTRNFKASGWIRRKILYNPKYADLPSEYLRFILLHEEGHLRRKQFVDLMLRIDYLILASSIALLFYYSDLKPAVYEPILFALSPFYVFLVPFSLRIFENAIQIDENEADEFATRTLKEKYSITRPSLVVADALKAVSEKRSESIVDRFAVLFANDIHPTDEERIERIRKKVDES